MVEWKKLGEICYISDYVSNGSFASLRENVQYKSEPDYAILLRFADYSNGFDKAKFVYIDEHAYNFLSKSSLDGGEIIMSNVGSCGSLFRCPKLKKKMSLAPNSILIKSESIDYLYYWLASEFGQEEIKKITSKSAMPKFNKTEFKKILAPIPSLEEQNRIVGILDKFTSSIDNLKDQIAQRRKQYEHYRDQLLDLEGKPGVEMKKLGETAKRNKGIPITAGQMRQLADEEGGVRVFAAGQTVVDIKESDLPKSCAIRLPSVIVKSRGYIDFEYYDNLFTHKNEMWSYSLENKTSIKYIYYYLSTQTELFRKKAKANSVKLPQLCVADTDNCIIPLPSLREQQRIVSILDKFEASITNLEEQLAHRQKQYEYYRNKLLTFE